MTGLREKKKKEAYNRILDAGKIIFFTQGYEKTTVEQIAEKADIGVGTIYNYFKTKADIFLQIIESELDISDVSYSPGTEALEKGIADAVWQFVWRVIKKINLINRRLLKEALYAMVGSMKSDKRFLNHLSNLDYQYIDKLKALLDSFKTRGLLSDEFDSDSASMVIYSIILTQTMIYAFTDEITFDQFKQSIKTQITFTLQGKSSGKEDKN
jgi:AcrR family transcriptional regulator